MSDSPDDPRCPECGGKIGQTATYCMHCSADLTDERAAADTDKDGTWDSAERRPPAQQSTDASGEPGASGEPTEPDASNELDASDAPDTADAPDDHFGTIDVDELLAPDGLVDNTLTVAVGITGGLVVGIIGTIVLAVVTGSGWALAFGLVAWLVATAYLVRRRTVQAAVAQSAYAVAGVLLLVPVIALSPVVSVDGGVGERGGLFVVLLVFVAVPAGVAAGIGWLASRFVPHDARGADG